ncbi:MAG TPA: hypothetical protein ENF21_03215 [Bacteroidetes bacterium]|nr:hypothetical protein [Bacteroidota bacterium]
MRTWPVIFLLLILPLSQLRLSVGTHYCGGQAVSSRIMVGGDLPGCGMKTTGEPCCPPDDSGVGFSPVLCCKDHIDTPATTDEYITEATFQFVNPGFAGGDVSPVAYPNIPDKPALTLQAGRSPPPVKKSMQVYLQTFLL